MLVSEFQTFRKFLNQPSHRQQCKNYSSLRFQKLSASTKSSHHLSNMNDSANPSVELGLFPAKFCSALPTSP